MNTRFRQNNPHWTLIVLPPVVTSTLIGLGGTLVSWGMDKDPALGAGIGIIAGIVFGSTIWSRMISSSPGRTTSFATDMATVTRPVQEIHVDISLPNGMDWPKFDLPDGVTFTDLVQTSKIVVENGYTFEGNMFYPRSATRPFSRPDYEALRLILLKHQFIAWRNPRVHNIGLYVCAPLGTRFFRRLSKWGKIADPDRTTAPEILYRLERAR